MGVVPSASAAGDQGKELDCVHTYITVCTHNTRHDLRNAQGSNPVRQGRQGVFNTIFGTKKWLSNVRCKTRATFLRNSHDVHG